MRLNTFIFPAVWHALLRDPDNRDENITFYPRYTPSPEAFRAAFIKRWLLLWKR